MSTPAGTFLTKLRTLLELDKSTTLAANDGFAPATSTQPRGSRRSTNRHIHSCPRFCLFAPLDRKHQRLGNPIIFALGRRFIIRQRRLSFSCTRFGTLRGRHRLVIFTSLCTFFCFLFFFTTTTTIRITAGAAGAMPWEWRAGDA